MLPDENNGVNDWISWGVEVDSSGLAEFGFGYQIIIHDGYEIRDGKLGWQLAAQWMIALETPQKNGPVDQEMRKGIAQQLTEECRANTRTGSGISSKEGTIHVEGRTKTFVLEFSQFEGKNGPMMYLKPRIELQTVPAASVGSNLSEAECQAKLTDILSSTARVLLHR